MKRHGDDSYSQFWHKLKDVQNYYFEKKHTAEFQPLCDDMLFEQIRSVSPSEIGVLLNSEMFLRQWKWRSWLIYFASLAKTVM